MATTTPSRTTKPVAPDAAAAPEALHATAEPDALHATAEKRLRDKQDFKGHLALYLVVNTFLWLIWALTMPGGFPWPIWVTAGWGIGIAAHAWDVYLRRPITERDIQEEMERLSGR